MTEIDLDDDDYYDDWEDKSVSVCPVCGYWLDDADYDFQICHKCRWSAAADGY